MKLNTLDGQNTALESKPVDSAPLKHSVERAMDIYFTNLDGQDVTNVYQMVLNEVEAPLLQSVMLYTRNNQTKASEVLGLNRGTLRKKLKQYDLL
jgi:Fis family transcriptional regulator